MVTLATPPPTPSYVRNQLYMLSLSDLRPDPEQPRQYLDPQALEELTTSIAQHGVLEPVLFRQDELTKGLYVVAGERRCAAARKAGLAEIPAVFIDSKNYAEIALVENLLRQDLTAIEESEAFDRLIKSHNYKQEDLAKILGKSQATISVTMSLNRLPQEIRDECRSDPTMPKTVLQEIARAKQERGMLTRYREYKQKQTDLQKKAEQTPTTRKRTPSETLLAAMKDLAGRIGKVDLTTWKAEECADFKAVIADINTAATEPITSLESTAKTTVKAKKKVAT